MKSLVDDIIMPPLGMIVGKLDFTDRFIAENRAAGRSVALP